MALERECLKYFMQHVFHELGFYKIGPYVYATFKGIGVPFVDIIGLCMDGRIQPLLQILRSIMTTL